jgi:peroxiredoxin Q/BCP
VRKTASRKPPARAAARARNAPAGGIEEGKLAPAFTLSDASGKKVSLSDLRGKHVIVYFYPKDDTPGCTKEACGFRDLWKDVQGLGAVVIGVSPDDGASHQKFAAKYRLPFPLLSDPDRSVMERYGAWGEKMMYGRRTVGAIRSTVWIGPDGKVRRHWARVPKAEDHPAHVLEALRAAG